MPQRSGCVGRLAPGRLVVTLLSFGIAKDDRWRTFTKTGAEGAGWLASLE
jgi:hypothetical protein